MTSTMGKVLAIAMLVLGGCGSYPRSAETSIVSREALVLWKQGHHLLDVRSDVEAQLGEIRGASRIRFGPERWSRDIPETEAQVFIRAVETLYPDRSMPILVFCNRGIRSEAAAALLRQKGYRQARSVQDGFMGNVTGEGLAFYGP